MSVNVTEIMGNGTLNLSEKLGGSIEIKDVEFRNGKYGEYALLTLGDDRKYITWSKILIWQLRRKIVNRVKEGKIVTAYLQERTSGNGEKYHTFQEIRTIKEV